MVLSQGHLRPYLLTFARRELDNWALLLAMMPPVPPWAAGNVPEPVPLDIDGFVDVSACVRLEEMSGCSLGVLDIQVKLSP